MYKVNYPRGSNKDRILECIFRNVGISRAEIAKETGITPATTTHCIAELIDEGYVYEIGDIASENNVGRRGIGLDIVSDRCFFIGIEIIEKTFTVGLFDLKGNILYKDIITDPTRYIGRVNMAVMEQVELILKENKAISDRILGVGIGLPGHIDFENNTFITNATYLDDLDISYIKKTVKIPVYFENNVRCMALGQYIFSPSETPDSFSYLHIGRGLYCASIVDEKMFVGNDFISGEIGHFIVAPEGQLCPCGKHGCLQLYCSERFIMDKVSRAMELGCTPILDTIVESPEKLTFKNVIDAYLLGEKIVMSYINTALEYISVLTGNIGVMMNPEKIFIHSNLLENDEIKRIFLNFAKRQLLFIDNKNSDTIEAIPFYPTDGARGAAALALHCRVLNIDYQKN